MNKTTTLLSMCLLALAFQHCSPKKTETTETTPIDTVAVDVIATSPAPSHLAFGAIPGFSVNNSASLRDTVNYVLLTNLDDLNKLFAPDKSAGVVVNPDFLINYIVAVACAPTFSQTTIVLDSAKTADSTIDVYVTIQRGEKQKTLTKPAQIFAIERRDGYIGLQFYINGKKDQVLMLPME